VANEELHQRGYLSTGKLKGTKFGIFEELNIGGTTVQELIRLHSHFLSTKHPRSQRTADLTAYF